MRTAAQVGISLLEFWELTPFEFSLIVQEAVDKHKQEQEDRIVAAYLTAYWQRVKTLPNLKSILKDMSINKPQTVEQMVEEIKRMNIELGGTVY